MNWPSISRHELPAELMRLYQRVPVKQLNMLFSVGLVLLLAWLAARLSWMLWPAPVVIAVQPLSSHTAVSQQSPAIDALLAAHIFGEYQAKAEAAPTPAPNPTDAPKTSLNLKLTGVVATKKKPEQGTAIIESNGVEQVYGVDEQIEGTSASLKQVLEDRVLLNVSGRFETLMLDGLEYQQLSAENSAYNEGELQEVQAVPEPMEYSPAQQDIAAMRREMLAEPAKLFDYIRITPRHRNGQMYGYALTPGKDPELFARMGLMPNDVAIEINGVRLNDMQQAYGLINELREAKEASIKVERDGEIKDVLFSLSQ